MGESRAKLFQCKFLWSQETHIPPQLIERTSTRERHLDLLQHHDRRQLVPLVRAADEQGQRPPRRECGRATDQLEHLGKAEEAAILDRIGIDIDVGVGVGVARTGVRVPGVDVDVRLDHQKAERYSSGTDGWDQTSAVV